MTKKYSCDKISTGGSIVGLPQRKEVAQMTYQNFFDLVMLALSSSSFVLSLVSVIFAVLSYFENKNK